MAMNSASSQPQAWGDQQPDEPRSARAVFVDKDGTLVHDVPYNVDPGQIELLGGVGAALRRLQDAGYLLFVVSNQPGVALRRFPSSALAGVEARLDELLAPFGVIVSGYCWCPHAPAGMRGAGMIACTCRKPRPGLLLDAATTHGIALDRSWMIGDILDDVEAGHRAGCRTILVDRGNETRWRAGRLRTPDAIVYQFADAAAIILEGTHSAAVGRPRAAPA
jgi:D-glycero-D-manno-heptose 1,7-bisphosphate phosphatase